MCVLLIETTNANPHLEASLDLAKKHLDHGDIVHYHFVGTGLLFSEFVERAPFTIRSISPERKGLSLIKTDELHCYFPTHKHFDFSFELPDFQSIEELLEFRYKTLNVGQAALNSLSAASRVPVPSLAANQRLLKKILLSSIAIYEYSLSCIRSLSNLDRVYVFNGRFANNRAVYEAAKSEGVSVYVHERGFTKERYLVVPFLLHDSSQFSKLISDYTSLVPDDICSLYGRSFFEDRRSGVIQDRIPFVRSQRKGYLPNVAVTDFTRVFSYFSSSEDEFRYLEDLVRWEAWPSQMAALKALLDIIRRHKTCFLFIRMHPYLAEKCASETELYTRLGLPDNVRLILPGEDVDSYELIDKSDVVISVGSTIGIEAVYWGKMSICLGPAVYDGLGVVNFPRNAEELERLLFLDDEPCNKGALRYGFFMKFFGTRFTSYQPYHLSKGLFLGVDLHGGWFGFARNFSLRIFRFWCAVKLVFSRLLHF